MFFTPIYYPAVITAALSDVVTGFLWYSPMFFGTTWKQLSGITEKQNKHNTRNALKHYVLSLLSAGIRACIIAIIFNAMLIAGPVEGLTMGALLWIGFVATTLLPSVLYQQIPWKLFFINSGYHLLSISIMSVILATWI